MPRAATGLETLSQNHALTKWKPRRIGIFFAQNPQENHERPTESHITETPDPPTETRPSENLPEKPWTCLVLVEPLRLFKSLSSHRAAADMPTESEDEFIFSYRKIVHETELLRKGNRPIGYTARCQSGPAWYTIEENNLSVTIKYVIELLEHDVTKNEQELPLQKKYAKFLTTLGNDIFWNWEEFTTQVAQHSAVSCRVPS